METTFFEKIFAIVKDIPLGKVATYGQIALLAGKPGCARLVGYAMRHAPDALPCHRVVNRSGSLAPAEVFGGQSRQRTLLEGEGVIFLRSGRVAMAKSAWNPIKPQ